MVKSSCPNKGSAMLPIIIGLSMKTRSEHNPLLIC